jgi:hypothetical protein
MTNHERLVQALNLWVSLTEFDDRRSQGRVRDWDINRMSNAIREGLELDNQNITGFLLLGYFADSFFKSTHFTVSEMLADPDKVNDFLARSGQLRAIVTDPEMLEDLRHFQLTTRQAVRHYQADTPEVMSLIENDYEMGFLRRDALRSMKNLRVDHFLAGEPEPEGVRPRYNREVFQFWNINSLLQCVCSSPSGVSINLIRTPDNFQSYFVFSIRNGGHVITLSDVPENAHPLQQYMSRRPDKQFGERVFQNWFPYHLTDMKYDEEQGRIYFEHKHGASGIVPINQQAFPLSALKDLNPHEVIWITLMFELIVERFWRQPVQPKQLSYTGDMIRVESTLLERASSAGLPVVQYEGLSLPSLAVEDVATPEGDLVSALGKDGGDHNQWLIDRYKHRVHEVSMNMLSTGTTTTYITSANEDAPTALAVADRRGLGNSIMDKEHRYPIRHLDSSSFGTREKLAADRIFIARHNLAMEIQRLADREFEARKEEILTWYRARIEANIERVYAMAHTEGAWGEYQLPRGNKRFSATCTYKTEEGHLRYQLTEMLTHEEWKRKHRHFEAKTALNQGWNSKAKVPYCHHNGATSSYILGISPQCKEDLAFLTNTPVNELPDVLQHWHVETDNTGNHLLSRIDPIAWALQNPWEENYLFNIRVALSTRAVNHIKKTAPRPEAFGYFSESGYVYPFRDHVPGLDPEPKASTEPGEDA